MNPADYLPWLWLTLLCLPPLLFVLVLRLLPRHAPDYGPMVIGNPMLNMHAIPAHVEPVLHPLLHLTRTRSDADLRALILGLRHMPITQTAPILRRYLHSPDPELQLYAQTILQEKQETLQNAFTKLTAKASMDVPANLASCMEAGLNLIESPLTPDSEHPSILRKLFPLAEQVLRSNLTHPRAVFSVGKFCLRTHQLDHASEMRRRLEPGSPLHETLDRLLAHHAPILHPPQPLTASYRIQ